MRFEPWCAKGEFEPVGRASESVHFFSGWLGHNGPSEREGNAFPEIGSVVCLQSMGLCFVRLCRDVDYTAAAPFRSGPLAAVVRAIELTRRSCCVFETRVYVFVREV